MSIYKVMKSLLSVLFFSYMISGCQPVAEDKAPNLLFVMMDDLGYGHFALNNDTLTTASFDPYFVDLVANTQAYSPERALEFSKKAIPTMNRLAREGVYFSHAYTSSNLCAPSRMGIATGILQNRLGIYRNTDCEERGLDPGSHLVEKIKEKGYATAHIGKWHIGRRRHHMLLDATQRHGVKDTLSYGQIAKRHPEIFQELLRDGYYGSVVDADHPLKNGFDYYYGYNNWASQFYNSTLVWENYGHAGKQEGYNTDVFTDRALAFMKKQVDREKPFYIQLHYHAVHDSLQPRAPDKYYDKFDSDSYDLNNFYAHVHGVDQNMARIIDYLTSAEELDNTIIVFTSDNGAQAGGPSVLPGNAPFAGHKGTYYQGGFRVPLFVYWPQGIPKAMRLDHTVSTMDILPTLIDASGGIVPDDLDGRSLLPLLSGQSKAPVHEYLVWAGLHARAWGFLLHTSFKSHGSERNFAPPSWVVVKDQYLLRYVGVIEPNVYKAQPSGGPPIFELFDYRSDPHEDSNLAETMPEKVDELAKIYYQEARSFPPPVRWKREKWAEIKGEGVRP